MMRTHNCGELRIADTDKVVELCGWVQRSRDLGGMTFIDLRDCHGIIQLAFSMNTNRELCEKARQLGREYVVYAKGQVIERSSKNPKNPTGDIEISVTELEVLNPSLTPPFTIEDDTDGGDDLRMKYRYLDLRRNPIRQNLKLRHLMAMQTRSFLHTNGFIEVETPLLIKSTPEGARDFLVPSRMNSGQFYALPQSPQTFKQLLMVAGLDRYFQLAKCFRDEDLRADRQPEFTQIDCEMSFVKRDDVLDTFENLIKYLFRTVKGVEGIVFERITYQDAMKYYGSDKPDKRFGMELVELNSIVKNKGFKVFDEADLVAGINVSGGSDFSRRQIDELTEWVKRPQIGAKNLIYAKFEQDGTLKSSVDKHFTSGQLLEWANAMVSQKGDLMLIIAGEVNSTRKALGELRLELGRRLGFRHPNKFACLWVIDFPLLEFDHNLGRYFAVHHPFTSPLAEDIGKLDTEPHLVRANAYDLVINGVEIGGGSIRIADRKLQEKMFYTLGFTPEQATSQFGFLLDAFQYGTPPHGGIALGFDRLCSLFGGSDSIRDYIAFPKNNSGRDVMIDSPSFVDQSQLDELYLQLAPKKDRQGEKS